MMRVFCVSAAAIILTSCGTAPQITHRYSSVSVKEVSDYPDLRIAPSLSSNPLTGAAAGLPITALGERAQAKYIEVLAGLIKDPDGLAAALAEDDIASRTPEAGENLSILRRRLVLGLFPVSGPLPPGDRLSYARVVVEADNAAFISWQRAANDYTETVVGEVSATREAKFSGGMGFNTGPAIVEPKISAEISSSTTESQKISDETSIHAALDPKRATIVQSAGYRDNLIGNAVLDMIMKPEADERTIIFTAMPLALGPERTPANSVFLRSQPFSYSGRKDPLCAKVTVDYEVRHVSSGASTFTEGDDSVVRVRGTAGPVTLRLAPPTVFRTYGLETGRGDPVNVSVESAKEARLAFQTQTQAERFLAWLRAARTARLANAVLRVPRPSTNASTSNLSMAEIASLVVVPIDLQHDGPAGAKPPC
ncbi:hypothetical protein [Azospirillum argentinense]|uniref:hypothetical protein n=1 Tax=Azospirillum argentinense TaxID=2970906 RepID=UPI0032DE6E0C